MKQTTKELIFLDDVKEYYSNSLKSFGMSPKGVDWNGEDGQVLRYIQLLKIIEGCKDLSLIDFGCGYGALINILNHLDVKFQYTGLDISEEMIFAATDLFKGNSNSRFLTASSINIASDFIVASGVFNVKLDARNDVWEKYIEDTLDNFNDFSQKGFSFNCLSSYSDKEKQEKKLFYADPMQLFNLCKKKYSTDVALLHNYGLYEFTILVNK